MYLEIEIESVILSFIQSLTLLYAVYCSPAVYFIGGGPLIICIRIPGGGSPIIGGGRIPIIGIGPPCIIIGGGGSPWIMPGPMFVGGGMATPPALGGPCAKGFEAIFPALKAAVVASMRCWACNGGDVS